jgi:hypothetical protein
MHSQNRSPRINVPSRSTHKTAVDTLAGAALVMTGITRSSHGEGPFTRWRSRTLGYLGNMRHHPEKVTMGQSLVRSKEDDSFREPAFWQRDNGAKSCSEA